MTPIARYFIPLFQRQLLALLLQNPETYGRFAGIWSHTYFDETHHRQIAHAYIKIRLAGGEHPTEASLFQELFKEQDPRAPVPLDLQALRKEAEALYAIPTANIDYSLKEVRLWAQNQALIQAINESVDLLQGGKVSEIRPTIDKALSVGADLQNQGITVNADTRNPSTVLLASGIAGLPIGMDTFDRDYIKGGLQAGEMLTVVGGPGVFKSGAMLNFSMPALGPNQGKKVTYISLEMPETQVYRRYCHYIARLNYDALRINPAKFDERFNEEVQNYRGALHIKAFGSCTLGIAQLRTYLDFLETKGHETELLIIDYPQIMARAEFGGDKEYISVGLLYAGARAIAADRQIPVIVAAQANREALKNPELLSLQHISATMDIARHSDFILAIIQTEEEKKAQHVRLKLLKNRNEESGVVVEAKIDYPLYTLTDLGQWNPKGEEPGENNSSTSHGDASKASSRRAGAAKNNSNSNAPIHATPGTILRAASLPNKELRARLRGGQK